MNLEEFTGPCRTIADSVGGREPMERIIDDAIRELRARFEIDTERTIEDHARQRVISLVEQSFIPKMQPYLHRRQEATTEAELRVAEQSLRQAWGRGVDGMLSTALELACPGQKPKPEARGQVTFLAEGGHRMEVAP